MLYRDLKAVCSEIHTIHKNTLCGQNLELLNVKLVVHVVITGLKSLISIIQTSQLMLYREIITLCSQIHTKHRNKLCGQNVELLNDKMVVHVVTTGFKTLNLCYTNQSVNAVSGNNRCWFSDPHKTHKYTL